MNRDVLVWGMGSLIACLLFLFLRNFEEKQRQKLHERERLHIQLQSEVQRLKDADDFMAKQGEKLKVLKKKGWLDPQNRILASEMIEKAGQSLNTLQITFEPEAVHVLKSKQQVRVTKILLVCEAFLDTDIYTFFQTLMASFPGVLVPQHIILRRVREGVDLEASTSEPKPTLISGTLIFEWVAFGRSHEAP